MTFEELAVRVDQHPRSDELMELFGQLVAARDARPGTSVLVARTFGGTHALVDGHNIELDEVLLDDLADWGLVRRQGTSPSGGEVLRVPADAATFYGWFLAQRGTPIDTVEEEVMNLVDGVAFSERHPTAAKALGEAFDLVRRGVVDVADLAEIGQHLRGALVDVLQSSAGLAAPEENVEKATKAARKAASERGDAAVVALIDLVEKVTGLDQAVTHARDEQANDRPVADAETVRRAAFLTAVACYELDRTSISP